MQKLTHEEILQRARAMNTRYDLSQARIERARNKIYVANIFCPIHKVYFKQRNCLVESNSAGCQECYKKKKRLLTKQKMAGSVKQREQKFIQGSERKFGKTFEFLDVFTSTTKRMRIRHKSCGKVFRRTPHSHLRTRGCPYCTKAPIKRTHEEFIVLAEEKYGDRFEYLEQYISTFTKMLMRCKVCSYQFKREPKSHLSEGLRLGCSKCYFSSRELTHEEFLKRVKNTYKGEYEVLSEYSPLTKRITIKHKRCGSIFTRRYDQFLYGESGCPSCYANKSERAFYEVLRSLVGKDLKIYRNLFPQWLRNPDTQKLLELDIYIPSLNLAFEIQGYQHYEPVEHWGGEAVFLKIQKRDVAKAAQCKERGVHLIPVDNRKFRGGKRRALIRSYLKPIIEQYRMAMFWTGNTTIEHYEPSPLEGTETLEEYPWDSVAPSWLKSID